MNELTKSLTSPKAERAVLGALVIDPTILAWLDLDAEHFTQALHKHMLAAITELVESDVAVDEVTVLDALGSKSSDFDVSAVTSLIVETPTSDNAEHWVGVLEEKRRLRSLSDASSRAHDRLRTGADDSGYIHDRLNEDLMEICAKGRVGSEVMTDVTEQELARMESQWDGTGGQARVPTGIGRLDSVVTGLPVGVPTAVGARPGVGKSTFLWNIAYSRARRGEDVLILTNEDRPEVAARLGIANFTGIERRVLLAGKLDPLQRRAVREAVEEMREANSHYHTLKVHGRSMKDICREAVGLIRRFNVKLLALDYIQNVPSPVGVTKRTYGIEENLTTLEALIAKEEIPAIIVGQVRRLEKGQRPTMADFKDSGSIEQKCKLMIALNPAEHDKLECCIVKNSEGRQGDIVELNYQPGYGRLD